MEDQFSLPYMSMQYNLINKLTIFLFILISASCNTKSNVGKSERWLEDISFDRKLDKKKFIICNGEENIYQYFNLGDNVDIEGDKPYILNHFREGYNSNIVSNDSGLIRIRFIVNCEGDTDRFRVIESDLNYKQKNLDKKVSTQLLDLTKSLKGWKQKFDIDNNPVDYYQYLVFKIEDGIITKILP